MTVLLDTHSWVWSFTDSSLLSPAARAAIESAAAVLVSPISFFEIGQKVRLGKWPELAGQTDLLPQIAEEQGALAAPFTPQIALHAALRDWAHRDPFDRMLASTAELHGLTLVTKDSVFTTLSGLRVIW